MFGRKGVHAMAEITASNLSKHLIAHCSGISNLKLQKLLYYSQAWMLAIYGKPLFDDRIEAWVHGPVVPSVFRKYRDFKWSPLTTEVKVEVSPLVSKHVDEVLKAYGHLQASALERLTHSEDPWKEARAGLAPDMSSTKEITQASMEKYYSARVNG